MAIEINVVWFIRGTHLGSHIAHSSHIIRRMRHQSIQFESSSRQSAHRSNAAKGWRSTYIPSEAISITFKYSIVLHCLLDAAQSWMLTVRPMSHHVICSAHLAFNCHSTECVFVFLLFYWNNLRRNWRPHLIANCLFLKYLAIKCILS